MSLMLRREEEDEEDEEDLPGSLTEIASRTGEKCGYCEEHLHYVEEVVHFSISRAFHNGAEIVLAPLQDEEGDYAYPPHFMSFSCWENYVEELNEMIVDAPPVPHADSLLRCDYCGSGICEWEIFGTGYLGEIHVSSRMPSGRASHEFVVNEQDPFTMCISCLLLQNEHTIELWESEDMNQLGECQECTHARCWRWKSCSCTCHGNENEPQAEVETEPSFVDAWKQLFK